MPCRFIRQLAFFCCAWLASAVSFAQIQAGDDVFDVGGAIKVFDEIEYSEAIQPDKAMAWKELEPKLKDLEVKLPNTGRYLRSFFQGGRILWWLADAKLKDRIEGETSDVIITYEQEQASVQKNGVVLIRKDIWEKLSAKSQAVLMFHQAMWNAIGEQYVKPESKIRALTSLILIQDLTTIDVEHLARFIKQFIGPSAAQTRFGALVDYDLSMAGAEVNYLVEEVVTPRSTDTLLTVDNTYRFTRINPNSQYRNIYFNRNFGLFADLGRAGVPELVALQIPQLCGSLKYANLNEWRLPTEAEIFNSFQKTLNFVRYIDMTHAYRTLNSATNTYADASFVSPQFFPRSPDLIVLSAEGTLINVSRGFSRVTDQYPVQSMVDGRWDRQTKVTYPRYFCVKAVNQ